MKTTDTHVYFWEGPFSNWHSCKFEDKIDGTFEFQNTEQAFMYYKARFFGDREISQLILANSSPKEVKRLGRKIQGYDDKAWECVREGYMTYVNYLKFIQNKDSRELLINTGERVLVEASPYDSVWGIGLGQDDPLILDESQWGRNLLGKSLMKVRGMVK